MVSKHLSIAMLVWGVAVTSASAAELLTNGNFETGTFAGWSVDNRDFAQGSFYIDTPGTNTPLTPPGYPTAPNAAGGSFYAVTEQNGPAAHTLRQTFTVPAQAQQLTLSFDLFFNNQALTDTKGPQGLDYSGPNNQHARVDILSASATAFDTDTGVLATLLESTTITSVPQPYTHYTYDLTSAFGGGPGTYQLRFAVATNRGIFNVGVDNVSMTWIPEPASLGILASAAALMLRRRRMGV